MRFQTQLTQPDDFVASCFQEVANRKFSSISCLLPIDEALPCIRSLGDLAA
jgi:hypothetical protein